MIFDVALEQQLDKAESKRRWCSNHALPLILRYSMLCNLRTKWKMGWNFYEELCY